MPWHDPSSWDARTTGISGPFVDGSSPLPASITNGVIQNLVALRAGEGNAAWANAQSAVATMPAGASILIADGTRVSRLPLAVLEDALGGAVSGITQLRAGGCDLIASQTFTTITNDATFGNIRWYPLPSWTEVWGATNRKRSITEVWVTGYTGPERYDTGGEQPGNRGYPWAFHVPGQGSRRYIQLVSGQRQPGTRGDDLTNSIGNAVSIEFATGGNGSESAITAPILANGEWRMSQLNAGRSTYWGWVPHQQHVVFPIPLVVPANTRLSVRVRLTGPYPIPVSLRSVGLIATGSLPGTEMGEVGVTYFEPADIDDD